MLSTVLVMAMAGTGFCHKSACYTSCACAGPVMATCHAAPSCHCSCYKVKKKKGLFKRLFAKRSCSCSCAAPSCTGCTCAVTTCHCPSTCSMPVCAMPTCSCVTSYEVHEHEHEAHEHEEATEAPAPTTSMSRGQAYQTAATIRYRVRRLPYRTVAIQVTPASNLITEPVLAYVR